MKKILVACEESQAVANAFRNLGYDAFSCDIISCSGGHPEYHIQCDVREIINEPWDMIIAFPPCTDLCASGARWFESKRKSGIQQKSIDFFMLFTNLSCPYVCIENPIGIMSNLYRKPDQIIQPWQFGHGEVKATCLWLKGLPKLIPTNIVDGRYPRVWKCPPGENRSIIRSKTYPGVALAMAQQWSKMLDNYKAVI